MPKRGMEPVRRHALVNAAIREIGTRGTLDVTVGQIARSAGMSSALAHHYFGSKEQMFFATMRHILTLYGGQVRGALAGAHTPRARAEAIVRASFSGLSQRPEHIAAWMNFYVQAGKTPQTARLLRIYHRRLYANLAHALRPLAPGRADAIAHGVAAMIDGFYCRHVLDAGPDMSGRAIATILDYIDTALSEASAR